MPELITEQEAFEQALYNFLQWLDVMTMEPVELCNTWGNYNVAWELVSDLKANGSSILNMPCGYLTEYQKQEVMNFLGSLENIPKSLLVSATSVAANQETMSHPCWAPYREAAAALLRVLDSAVRENRTYYNSD